MKHDRTNLLRDDGAINLASVMRDAHRQRRVMTRLGWSWGECLKYSMTRARANKEARRFFSVERAMRELCRDD